ncbi:MFS transporter [Nocardioides euryhalodurans]|uniref:MFS transporter n=1 Tax=Nocardioides euryhalodurans TaxID=2518370 RepID=A0A4P7GNR1_9ACTN|nr:MFS transporter [Nocardioides euryhalodurans]QBR93730.1 MFS transporter [Nocardioides euryhalodurans]
MATTIEPTADVVADGGGANPAPGRTAALISLLLASTMELIDTTIVNVALPTIEADLGATGSQLQWMVAAYPLAFAVALVTGARLGDAFGRKRLFLLGLVAFTVMSTACGLAPTAEALVAFRALQGFGAAAMIPQVMSSIQVMYAPEERAKAMGAFTGLAGLATVAGPVLGAVLTQADIGGTGWRPIFLINIPVGLLALAAAIRFIPESYAARRPSLDPVGVLTLGGGLLAVLYPLTMGREEGWPAWVFALMALGVAVLVRFGRSQHRAETRGEEPLVLLGLYGNRGFAGGSLVLLVLFVSMSAYFLAQTIYFQAGLGWSVLKAGLVGVPFAVTTAVFAGFGVTVLAPRIGRRVLQHGAVVLAAGAVVTAATVHVADPTTAWWVFVPALVVSGAGFGLMVAPIGMFTVADVPVEKAGAASGLFNTTTQLANAVGVALLGTLFFEVVSRQVGSVPAELFGPAYEVVLGAVALLMGLAWLAARTLPETAPEEVPELV